MRQGGSSSQTNFNKRKVRPKKAEIETVVRNQKKNWSTDVRAPSVNEISKLYMLKKGQASNNIIDLYNFYLELTGEQELNSSDSEKKEYKNILAEDYLMPKDSEYNTFKNENCDEKSPIILNSLSLDMLPNNQRATNSITT